MGQLIRSSDDLILHAGDGSEKQPGDLIFKTNGVERGRISANGTGAGILAAPFMGTKNPATFLPSGAEYIWFETDGAGTLVDIISGVA